MNYQNLVLVTPPTVDPVTLEEAKAHLRMDTTDEDDLISLLIKAATDYVQNYTGRALVMQTWDYYLPEFPANNAAIPLPYSPAQSVTSITYKDEDAANQTLSSSTIYAANITSNPAFITLRQDQAWPETYFAWDAVKVRFVAGYPPIAGGGSPTDYASGIPAAIKAAVLLVIGDLYDNREGQSLSGNSYQINHTVKNLLYPYRVDLGI